MRRERRWPLALLLLLVVTQAAWAERILAVDGVRRTTADLPRAVAFYTTVLPFTLVSHDTGAARLRLGDAMLVLVAAPATPSPPRANDRRFQHLAIVVRDVAAAWARVAPHATAISDGPQRLPDGNPDAGGITALYFRDPDGHPLELIAYPPDKGDPRWHRPGTELFLGVDHTAIAVGDEAAALRFWRDRLGLRVVGHSDNHGAEQAALSGVPGAHVRITALRAPAGIGVELLAWQSPAAGPLPPDEPAGTTTELVGEAPGRLRDPDGHLLLIHAP